MSNLIKQIWNDNQGMVLKYRLFEMIRPRNYFRIIKWNRQRINKGWSDKDTWGAGEHILEVVVGMLRFLDKEQNVLDWDEYFKANYRSVGKYKNLSEVADDIQQYLDFELTSWADDLNVQENSKEFDITKNKWIDKDGRVLSDDDITKRIKNWTKESEKSYQTCKKAMTFVANNIRALWW